MGAFLIGGQLAHAGYMRTMAIRICRAPNGLDWIG